MMPVLEYRDYKGSDLDGLEELIHDIWFEVMDRYGPGHGEDLIWHFTYHYLSQINRAKVAVEDGKVVGFVGGHMFSQPMGQISKDASLERDLIRGRLEAEGSCPSAFLFYDRVEGMCAKAKEMAGGRFDSELVLFAVSPSMQGRGVGSSLLKMSGFRGGDAGRYYFYTTGNCNVGYYTHSGYKLVCKEELRDSRIGLLEWYMFSNDPSSD